MNKHNKQEITRTMIGCSLARTNFAHVFLLTSRSTSCHPFAHLKPTGN